MKKPLRATKLNIKREYCGCLELTERRKNDQNKIEKRMERV